MATSIVASGAGFKVALDKSGLRLVSISVPGTLSIDTLLTSLGGTGQGLSDYFTLSDPSIKFVRSVPGQDGEGLHVPAAYGVRMEGVEILPSHSNACPGPCPASATHIA